MKSQQLKHVLETHGLEVFRVDEELQTIHVAERVRHHLMDANVAISFKQDVFSVRVICRGQQSDFPDLSAEQIFTQIRQATCAVRDTPWREESTRTVQVRDPSNPSMVLDVWHEIAFTTQCRSADEAVSCAREALAHERQLAAEPNNAKSS